MRFPKHLILPFAFWGVAATAVVVLSDAAMAIKEREKPSMALQANTAQDLGSIDDLMVQDGSMVSQNATAPDASANMPAVVANNSCNITLDLLDEGSGMVGGTLMAPCLTSQDLVIAHAGLVFSAKTLDSGTLFFSLPAMKSPATVDVRFSTGEEASAQLDMPDALNMRRVAVQWPFADGFAIHAFEDGAEFGAKGHIWAESSGVDLAQGAEAKMPASGGYLTVLGDATVALPLMAQVFTYGPAAKTDVILEAAVTQNNCDGELTGDLITAQNGAVKKIDMVLAMPACDAVGEFVHLGLPEEAIDLAMKN